MSASDAPAAPTNNVVEVLRAMSVLRNATQTSMNSVPRHLRDTFHAAARGAATRVRHADHAHEVASPVPIATLDTFLAAGWEARDVDGCYVSPAPVVCQVLRVHWQGEGGAFTNGKMDILVRDQERSVWGTVNRTDGRAAQAVMGCPGGACEPTIAIIEYRWVRVYTKHVIGDAWDERSQLVVTSYVDVGDSYGAAAALPIVPPPQHLGRAARTVDDTAVPQPDYTHAARTPPPSPTPVAPGAPGGGAPGGPPGHGPAGGAHGPAPCDQGCYFCMPGTRTGYGVPGEADGAASKVGGLNHQHCNGELCRVVWKRTTQDGSTHCNPASAAVFGPGCITGQFPLPSAARLLADSKYAGPGTTAADLAPTQKRHLGYRSV